MLGESELNSIAGIVSPNGSFTIVWLLLPCIDSFNCQYKDLQVGLFRWRYLCWNGSGRF